MWEQIELSRHVKVARRPPGEAELDAISKQGIRAVVDLRTDTETFADAAAPLAEAASVRARGMEYIRVPVSTSGVGKQDLDRVGAVLRDAPKPLLIHCASGKRAGMMAVVHSAIESGVPGQEMLEMARNLDLVYGEPAQQQIFAHYVDEQQTRPDPLARRHEALQAEGHPIPLLPEDTLTLAEEMHEDHHRHLAQDEGIAGPAIQPPHRRSRVRVLRTPLPSPPAPAPVRAPVSVWRPDPRVLGGAAAVAGAILLVFDRRVVLPMLLAAGIVSAWVVDTLRAIPPAPPSSADRDIDREIADLERRVHRMENSV